MEAIWKSKETFAFILVDDKDDFSTNRQQTVRELQRKNLGPSAWQHAAR